MVWGVFMLPMVVGGWLYITNGDYKLVVMVLGVGMLLIMIISG